MTVDMSHSSKTEPLTREALQALLAPALPGARFDMRDDTHKHLEHNIEVDHHGAHFFVKIVWNGFKGMVRIDRHRMIFGLLTQQWNAKQIHSLSLRLMTEEEAIKTLRE